MTMVLAGCGDSLLGSWSIEERIGSPPLTAGSQWEVRWVQESGLAIDCQRVDAGVETDELAVVGSAELPLPQMPAPRFVDAGPYRFALAFPVLVEAEAPYTEPGDGEASLEPDLGVWGTSAPLAWLVVEGDLAAAGADLLANGGPAPAQGWVDVHSEDIWESGDIDQTLDPIPTESLDGSLHATALYWTDDEAYDVWAGLWIGGIASTCEAP
ncbi:MAG: hypothetical protein H6737_21385 [Alphaproteobacteria bacterium]|nr:hypothetical protein [Alphaproteobacteria bacterium]